MIQLWDKIYVGLNCFMLSSLYLVSYILPFHLYPTFVTFYVFLLLYNYFIQCMECTDSMILWHCILQSPMQWSFGVTCWEVFTGGHIPYSGISPVTLLHLLRNGDRLNKPMNPACSDEMWVECKMEIERLKHSADLPWVFLLKYLHGNQSFMQCI